MGGEELQILKMEKKTVPEGIRKALLFAISHKLKLLAKIHKVNFLRFHVS